MQSLIIQLARKITPVPEGHVYPRDGVPTETVVVTPDPEHPNDIFGYCRPREERYHAHAPQLSITVPSLASMDGMFGTPVSGVRINGNWFIRAAESEAAQMEKEFQEATDQFETIVGQFQTTPSP